ncbi:C40 family peptidase [Paenibacillus thiaminolyticus]|uniref:C40 family peptidase n=1 Tax=Paenibacillus thiaminolyticus TaxID=49283 RepID=UPI00197D474E
MKPAKFGKILISVSLSVSFLMSASVMMPLQPVSAATATTSSAKAKSIIATGKKYMGVPYKFGAKSGITSAFDCSSFVQYLYKKQGIKLPRTSKQQSKVGTKVSKSQMKPGDLVFFYSPVHHVAIYIGDGKILHTYGKPGVTLSSLDGNWGKRITGIRRVL